MFSLVSLLIAILYFCIGLRIVAFTSTTHRVKPFFSFLAVVMVGFFLGSSINILVNGQHVTFSEAVLTFLFFVIIFVAKGNVAELFRIVVNK